MRVSRKVILLMVFALAGTIFALGKASEEEKMTAKEAVSAEEGMEMKEAAKEADTAEAEEMNEEKEEKEAEMPAAEPSAEKPAEKSPSMLSETEAGEGKDVAVKVNDEVITEAEVDAKLAPVLQRASMQMDPNMVAMYAKKIRGQVLEGMIVEKLLDGAAAKAGIKVTESDVNDRIGQLLVRQGITMENLGSILQMQGQSMEQFRDQMHKGLMYENLMEAQVGKVDINEADAMAFYEDNKKDFNTPEQVQASHILIKVSPSATAEERAAAKAKAEKLLEEIKEGADFAELARENSDDPGSKMKGGDLGYFGKGQMVREFENAAFGLQPGEISGIVETQFGYHIIKVTGRKQAGMTPFADVKDDIIENLEQQRKSRMFRQYVDKLRAEADIVYPEGEKPTMTIPLTPTGGQEQPENE